MITLHTNFGDINIELDFEKAPISAANFLQYCRDDFYTNTIYPATYSFTVLSTALWFRVVALPLR